MTFKGKANALKLKEKDEREGKYMIRIIFAKSFSRIHFLFKASFKSMKILPDGYCIYCQMTKTATRE